MMIISKFPVYSMRLSIPGFVSICQLTLQRWFVQIISIHSILTFHDRSRHGQPDNGIDSDKVTKCRNKGKGRQKIACQWTGCLILLAIIGSRYGGLATKSVQCKDIGFLTMLEIALILVYKKNSGITTCCWNDGVGSILPTEQKVFFYYLSLIIIAIVIMILNY